MAPLWLALRSLLWAVLLPGFLAFFVPWRFFGVAHVTFTRLDLPQLVGIIVFAGGVVLLAASIFEFARSGRGTLSPVDPPRTLVVRGLYRHVRNPMYLSVSLVILGQALMARSLALVVYWLVWFLLANLFVVIYEEPALRRQFGRSYDEYAERVGRWLPH